jgi:hypothetical protein
MPTPATPSDPNAAEIPPSFEDKVKGAWERNGTLAYIVVGVIALAVVVKGAMDYFAVQKELTVQQDYAACTAGDMLTAFADSHRGHPLAGVADLRAGDMAYQIGHFGEAAADYSAALPDLASGPIVARAKLGLAMAQSQSGKAVDAEAGLRQLLGDESQLKPIRCEAAYQLAVLEMSQGRTGEVQQLTDRLMQIDPSSPFAQRAALLRSSVPQASMSLSVPAAAPSGH